MVQPGPIRVALDAHVVGRRQTGNETYIVNLAEALAAHPDVAPLVYIDAAADWAPSTAVDVRRLTARTPFLRIPIELPLRARWDRADLLHVQYVAPLASGLPLVTTIHDLSFEDVPGIFPRRTELRLRWFVRRSAGRSSAVVTISEFTKSRLVHHYGLDPARIFVTPLAVAARWHPLAPGERARRLRGLGLSAPFVLAVGNMHPRKNIPRLVRAMAHARRVAGDLHLVLVGSRGWRSQEIDTAIDAVDGRSWIHLPGHVDDDALQALYGESHVMAYPSMYEGFGLPVLEALACGAIVVAGNATATPEVAGDAAVLVDPTEDEALIDGLIRAATDETLRTRLAAAGPRHAAWFTWDRCAEGTVAAYRMALQHAGGD